MRAATDRLSEDNASQVLEFAALPEHIRGYEDIKLRALETYYERRGDLLDALAEDGRAHD